jgi:thiol peroxidase
MGRLSRQKDAVEILLVTSVICFSVFSCKEKTMKERKGIVTFKGNPLTVLGNEVKTGQQAPDFEVVANDMSVVSFSSFAGQVCIICAVPSLDTPVCDTETRRFNEEAGKLGENVKILTISMDLPFAQKRWCAAAGIKNLQTLSDYREANFGTTYGILIKEMRLLARAIFVVDKTERINYIQLVKEMSSEPDYQAVLDVAKKTILG